MLKSVSEYSMAHYHRSQKVLDKLGLEKLENFPNEERMIIWVNWEEPTIRSFYYMKKTRGNWKCLHYNYVKKYPLVDEKRGYNWSVKEYDYDSLVIESSEVKEVKSRKGWDYFINDLDKTNVGSLIDQFEIPGFIPQVSDGTTYTIEYQKYNRYHFYSYNCPDYYKNKYKECAEMDRILKLFYSNFTDYEPSCGLGSRE